MAAYAALDMALTWQPIASIHLVYGQQCCHSMYNTACMVACMASMGRLMATNGLIHSHCSIFPQRKAVLAASTCTQPRILLRS
jgi:hypothetical protein